MAHVRFEPAAKLSDRSSTASTVLRQLMQRFERKVACYVGTDEGLLRVAHAGVVPTLPRKQNRRCFTTQSRRFNPFWLV
jgi:hypothetical protein